MTQTKLRVPQGVSLTAAMESTLTELIGTYTAQTYLPTPDLRSYYSERINSLTEAFTYLLEAHPPTDKAKSLDLKRYLAHCVTLAELPLNANINDYQQILNQFVPHLVNAIIDQWFLTTDAESIEEATEMLNKAEQYVIASKTREPLATIIPLLDANNQYAISYEEPLPALHPETLKEFMFIKANAPFNSPSWFNTLNQTKQLYFASLPPDTNEFTPLKQQVSALISAFGNKPKYPPFNDWLNTLPPQSILIAETLLALDNDAISLKELNELAQLIDNLKKQPQNDASFFSEINQLSKYPLWFIFLTDYEQRYLEALVSKVSTEALANLFIPSRMRTLPGLANRAMHHFFIINEAGQCQFSAAPKERSSHISSRDITQLPPAIGALHSMRNLSLLAPSKGPLLIQTLISPIPGTNNWLPDIKIHEQSRTTIAKSAYAYNIISTNHPFNIANKGLYATLADEGAQKLINQVTQRLTDDALNNYANTLFGNQEHVNKNNWIKNTRQQLLFIENNRANPHAYATLQQLTRLWLENIPPLDRTDLIPKLLNAQKHIKKLNDISTLGTLQEESESIFDNQVMLFLVLYKTKLESINNWIEVFAALIEETVTPLNQPKQVQNETVRLINLLQLSHEYQRVLDSGYGTVIHDPYARELFLSTLEQHIVSLLQGHCYGSCVSGKDRKAIELIHSDASWAYHHLYQRWPSFTDEGLSRDNFVTLIATFYISRHQQAHADQNAAGCRGLKTPKNYLPTDVTAKVKQLTSNKNYLSNEDTLATNNEVDKMGNISAKITPLSSNNTMLALNLSDTHRNAILKEITALINSPFLWQPDSWTQRWVTGNCPTGVKEIKELMENETNSVEKLAAIYTVIKNRQGFSDTSRENITTDFYTCIETIRANTTDSQAIEIQLNALKAINPYTSTAEKLSQTNRERLINLLKILCGENKLWNEQVKKNILFFKPDAPEGVASIKALLNEETKDVKNDNHAQQIISSILFIAKRQENKTSEARTTKTASFYKALSQLLTSDNPNESIEETCGTIKSIYNSSLHTFPTDNNKETKQISHSRSTSSLVSSSVLFN